MLHPRGTGWTNQQFLHRFVAYTAWRIVPELFAGAGIGLAVQLALL